MSGGDRRPQALYRFYGQTGELIYVGITNSLGRRVDRHERDKPWWTEVAEARVEHYPDRESVRHAEVEAIQTERPKYNIHHNGTDRERPVVATDAARKVYPIKLDDCVALCASNGECPTGLVTGVFEFGVKIALFDWFTSEFGMEMVLRWDLISEIHFAHKNDKDLYDLDPLGRVQMRWHKQYRSSTDAEMSV